MVKSMTGYGRCEQEANGRKVHVEISSVNHRYCDLNIRLPRTLNPLEDSVRKYVKEHIGRGKVEVNIFYTTLTEEDYTVAVNEAVCKAYVEALRQVGTNLDLKDNLGLAQLMHLNEVITIQKKSVDQEVIWELLQQAIEVAMKEFLTMREAEGQALYLDLNQKSAYIREVVKKLEAVSPLVVEQYKVKLEERLAKLVEKGTVDEVRLATEVALFADRAAIDEEITRLKSHLDQLQVILDEGGHVGRKLDFLMQEMNREANTIASKANDYSVTGYAVELKTEIEKMREQIQNIE